MPYPAATLVALIVAHHPRNRKSPVLSTILGGSSCRVKRSSKVTDSRTWEK